jgi:hypothetical protein
MIDYFIDALVVIVFLALTTLLWAISNTRKIRQNRILLRSISLFVFLHLVVFPLVYTIIINNDSESIRIDESIFEYEKEKKLEEAQKIEASINSDLKIKHKKNEISSILNTDKTILDSLNWKKNVNKRLIFLKNRILIPKIKYKNFPSDQVGKLIEIYYLNGQKSATLISYSDENYISRILEDNLLELDAKKNKIKKEIEKIKSNSFWTYRQVLPYTINILFTSNFEPKRQTANLVYFIHNFLVLGFLLSLIVSSFQHFLENKK